jgi:hypothetical protein
MSLVGTEITEGREEMGMLLLWSVEKPSNRVICKLISIAMNFNYEITWLKKEIEMLASLVGISHNIFSLSL